MQNVRIRSVHEVLFSLNTASAIVLWLLVAGFGSGFYAPSDYRPPIPFRYFFVKAAIRLSFLLHLQPDGRAAVALTALISLLSLAMILLLFLRSSAGSAIYRILLSWIAGLSSLLAIPIALVYSTLISPNGLPLPWTVLWPMLLADLVCISGLMYRSHQSRPSNGIAALLFSFHYGFWSWILISVWNKLPEDHQLPVSIFPWILLVFPTSGIAWLLYLRRPHESSSEPLRNHWGLSVAAALIPLAVLAVLWVPAPGYSISSPKDPGSVTLTMTRAAGFGRGPEYTVTLHGDGLVEYIGKRNVGVLGSQESKITRERLTTLLQDFDRIGFSSLDERAFAPECADGARVSVSVIADRRKKTVGSDSGVCVGAKSGPQAQFVRVAAEIDRAVDSDRWVHCNGPCQR